ncbi:MAG: pilus assembly protein PilP [Deltaproteobacteria bacterium]|nr:pilus assembly protein PilP [Deltaproteobacteria bacterium]
MDRHRNQWKFVGLCFAMMFFTAAVTSARSPKPMEHIELGAEGKSIQNADKTPEEYTYIPGERRDPFVSLLRRGEQKNNTEDELTPLQRVEISDLHLVGIVEDPEGNKALVQTPDGRGYTLRVGLRVGKHDGTVKRILDDKVIIQEKKADILGQITVSKEILELKKEEGNR